MKRARFGLRTVALVLLFALAGHAHAASGRHVAPAGGPGDRWHGPRRSAAVSHPSRIGAGGVLWDFETMATAPVPIWPWELARGESLTIDSVAYWREQAARRLPAVSAASILRRATLALADGDSLAADSLLGAGRVARSIWAWEALRRRSVLAAARGMSRRADSLLESADRREWPESERAAWLEQRAAMALAAGDTASALEWSRQIVRVYPGMAPAGRALNRLDALTAARGETLDVALERAGGEVEAMRAARPAAIERLQRVLPRTGAAERGAVWLRLAELNREARHPLAARAAADSAAWLANDPAAAAQALLERARALRDGGATDSALALYARLASGDAAPAMRAAALWESARECEDRGRYPAAAALFGRLADAGDRRSDEARVRAGLARFVTGDAAGARALWSASTGEAARFWLGISLRRTNRGAGDSLLTALARLPGYAFYRAAARESLGITGWPGTLTAEQCVGDTFCTTIADARVLAFLGLDEEAGTLLARWAALDPRLVPAGRTPDAAEWLAAARVAYALGAAAQGTRLAERAFAEAAAVNDSAAWAAVPWAYPPANSREVVAAESLGVERALLWALIRQESRFDPRARSRSDALGLTQLKRAAAGDMAARFRDPAPGDSVLFDPGTSIRYGARYLAGLLKRFEGRVSVALAAYNAGPGSIRTDWRSLFARGGEALFAEYASNADSQDYAKRILGFRAAYHELRPAVSP